MMSLTTTTAPMVMVVMFSLVGVVVAQPADECEFYPCGRGQTCTDPAPFPDSLNDFVCTCDLDSRVQRVGDAATCSCRFDGVNAVGGTKCDDHLSHTVGDSCFNGACTGESICGECVSRDECATPTCSNGADGQCVLIPVENCGATASLPEGCPSVFANTDGVVVLPQVAEVGGRGEVEVGGLQLFSVPDHLQNGLVHVFDHQLAMGSVIGLKCCGPDECDFVVSVYHCPPCSGDVNGGLPGMLLTEGFLPSSCAAKFSPSKYPMVSFRKTLSPGTELILPVLTSDVRYLSIYSTRQLPHDWCYKSSGPKGPGSDNNCIPCAPTL